MLTAETVLDQVRQNRPLDGITFTGGEPMEQAAEILPLARLARRAGLSIVCYTGYLLQEIQAGTVPGGRELLGLLDILIDGPYVATERAALLWRGSRNQKVHFLTDRHKALEPLTTREGYAAIEVQVHPGEVALTGSVDPAFWNMFRKHLAATQREEDQA